MKTTIVATSLAIALAWLAPGAWADLLPQGKVAPEIKGEQVHGDKVDLAALKGKVVVLEFFASW